MHAFSTPETISSTATSGYKSTSSLSAEMPDPLTDIKSGSTPDSVDGILPWVLEDATHRLADLDVNLMSQLSAEQLLTLYNDLIAVSIEKNNSGYFLDWSDCANWAQVPDRSMADIPLAVVELLAGHFGSVTIDVLSDAELGELLNRTDLPTWSALAISSMGAALWQGDNDVVRARVHGWLQGSLSHRLADLDLAILSTPGAAQVLLNAGTLPNPPAPLGLQLSAAQWRHWWGLGGASSSTEVNANFLNMSPEWLAVGIPSALRSVSRNGWKSWASQHSWNVLPPEVINALAMDLSTHNTLDYLLRETDSGFRAMFISRMNTPIAVDGPAFWTQLTGIAIRQLSETLGGITLVGSTSPVSLFNAITISSMDFLAWSRKNNDSLGSLGWALLARLDIEDLNELVDQMVSGDSALYNISADFWSEWRDKYLTTEAESNLSGLSAQTLDALGKGFLDGLNDAQIKAWWASKLFTTQLGQLGAALLNRISDTDLNFSIDRSVLENWLEVDGHTLKALSPNTLMRLTPDAIQWITPEMLRTLYRNVVEMLPKIWWQHYAGDATRIHLWHLPGWLFEIENFESVFTPYWDEQISMNWNPNHWSNLFLKDLPAGFLVAHWEELINRVGWVAFISSYSENSLKSWAAANNNSLSLLGTGWIPKLINRIPPTEAGVFGDAQKKVIQDFLVGVGRLMTLTQVEALIEQMKQANASHVFIRSVFASNTLYGLGKVLLPALMGSDQWKTLGYSDTDIAAWPVSLVNLICASSNSSSLLNDIALNQWAKARRNADNTVWSLELSAPVLNRLSSEIRDMVDWIGWSHATNHRWADLSAAVIAERFSAVSKGVAMKGPTLPLPHLIIDSILASMTATDWDALASTSTNGAADLGVAWSFLRGDVLEELTSQTLSSPTPDQWRALLARQDISVNSLTPRVLSLLPAAILTDSIVGITTDAAWVNYVRVVGLPQIPPQLIACWSFETLNAVSVATDTTASSMQLLAWCINHPDMSGLPAGLPEGLLNETTELLNLFNTALEKIANIPLEMKALLQAAVLSHPLGQMASSWLNGFIEWTDALDAGAQLALLPTVLIQGNALASLELMGITQTLHSALGQSGSVFMQLLPQDEVGNRQQLATLLDDGLTGGQSLAHWQQVLGLGMDPVLFMTMLDRMLSVVDEELSEAGITASADGWAETRTQKIINGLAGLVAAGEELMQAVQDVATGDSAQLVIETLTQILEMSNRVNERYGTGLSSHSFTDLSHIELARSLVLTLFKRNAVRVAEKIESIRANKKLSEMQKIAENLSFRRALSGQYGGQANGPIDRLSSKISFEVDKFLVELMGESFTTMQRAGTRRSRQASRTPGLTAEIAQPRTSLLVSAFALPAIWKNSMNKVAKTLEGTQRSAFEEFQSEIYSSISIFGEVVPVEVNIYWSHFSNKLNDSQIAERVKNSINSELLFEARTGRYSDYVFEQQKFLAMRRGIAKIQGWHAATSLGSLAFISFEQVARWADISRKYDEAPKTWSELTDAERATIGLTMEKWEKYRKAAINDNKITAASMGITTLGILLWTAGSVAIAAMEAEPIGTGRWSRVYGGLQGMAEKIFNLTVGPTPSQFFDTIEQIRAAKRGGGWAQPEGAVNQHNEFFKGLAGGGLAGFAIDLAWLVQAANAVAMDCKVGIDPTTEDYDDELKIAKARDCIALLGQLLMTVGNIYEIAAPYLNSPASRVLAVTAFTNFVGNAIQRGENLYRDWHAVELMEARYEKNGYAFDRELFSNRKRTLLTRYVAYLAASGVSSSVSLVTAYLTALDGGIMVGATLGLISAIMGGTLPARVWQGLGFYNYSVAAESYWNNLRQNVIDKGFEEIAIYYDAKSMIEALEESDVNGRNNIALQFQNLTVVPNNGEFLRGLFSESLKLMDIDLQESLVTEVGLKPDEMEVLQNLRGYVRSLLDSLIKMDRSSAGVLDPNEVDLQAVLYTSIARKFSLTSDVEWGVSGVAQQSILARGAIDSNNVIEWSSSSVAAWSGVTDPSKELWQGVNQTDRNAILVPQFGADAPTMLVFAQESSLAPRVVADVSRMDASVRLINLVRDDQVDTSAFTFELAAFQTVQLAILDSSTGKIFGREMPMVRVRRVMPPLKSTEDEDEDEDEGATSFEENPAFLSGVTVQFITNPETRRTIDLGGLGHGVSVLGGEGNDILTGTLGDGSYTSGGGNLDATLSGDRYVINAFENARGSVVGNLNSVSIIASALSERQGWFLADGDLNRMSFIDSVVGLSFDNLAGEVDVLGLDGERRFFFSGFSHVVGTQENDVFNVAEVGASMNEGNVIVGVGGADRYTITDSRGVTLAMDAGNNDIRIVNGQAMQLFADADSVNHVVIDGGTDLNAELDGNNTIELVDDSESSLTANILGGTTTVTLNGNEAQMWVNMGAHTQLVVRNSDTDTLQWLRLDNATVDQMYVVLDGNELHIVSTRTNATGGTEVDSKIRLNGNLDIDNWITFRGTITQAEIQLGWFASDQLGQEFELSLAADALLGAARTSTVNLAGTAYTGIALREALHRGLDPAILGVNAPQILGNAAAMLPGVQEDWVPADAAHGGKTITELLEGRVVDADGDTLQGVLVEGNASNLQEGTWEYRNSAGRWVTMGSYANSHALYLDKNSMLRFVPALNYHGAPGRLSLRLVTGGGLVTGVIDTQILSPTYLSAGALELATSIVSVNDRPVVTENVTQLSLDAVSEDTLAPAGELIRLLVTAAGSGADPAENHLNAFTDPDSDLGGVLVTGNAALANQGRWQYGRVSSTGSMDWDNVPVDTGHLPVYLAAASFLRFVPASNFHGTPGALTVRLVDGTATWPTGEQITVGMLADTNAVSEAGLQLGTCITAVNDRPLLANSGAIAELRVEVTNDDVVVNLQELVARYFSDADGDLLGKVRFSVAGSQVPDFFSSGWQYRVGNGDWVNMSNDLGSLDLNNINLRYQPFVGEFNADHDVSIPGLTMWVEDPTGLESSEALNIHAVLARIDTENDDDDDDDDDDGDDDGNGGSAGLFGAIVGVVAGAAASAAAAYGSGAMGAAAGVGSGVDAPDTGSDTGSDGESGGGEHTGGSGGAGIQAINNRIELALNFLKNVYANSQRYTQLVQVSAATSITKAGVPIGDDDINDLEFNYDSNTRTYTGTRYNDRIEGTDESEIFIGVSGADRLSGRGGNDVYVMDGNDYVRESAGNGYDMIWGSSDFMHMPDHVEGYVQMESFDQYDGDGNRIFIHLPGESAPTPLRPDINSTVYGNAQNNFFVGNAGANHFYGYEGNDVFVGGGGADELYGGLGDDTYIISASQLASVSIHEYADEGIDSVAAGGSYTLGAKLERLFLMDDAPTNSVATGNDLANVLVGNGRNNVIWGLAGTDKLFGGAGNDTLDGGLGNDLLWGEAGDDTYVYASGDGADTVTDSQGADVLRLADNIVRSRVSLERDAHHLVVKIAASGSAAAGQITLSNWFAPAAAGGLVNSVIRLSLLSTSGVREEMTRAQIRTMFNDAPTTSANLLNFPDQAEDTASPVNVGVAFAALMADINGDRLAGVLITRCASAVPVVGGGEVLVANAATAVGRWEYSEDGSTWTAIPLDTLGTVSSPQALYLRAEARLRFVPALNYGGPALVLSARVVDDTATWSESPSGTLVSAGTWTTSSAFSQSDIEVRQAIAPVNDAPEVYAGVTSVSLLSVNEDTKASDGKTVTELLKATSPLTVAAGAFTDVDGTDTLGGILVTQNASHAAQGTWEYRLAGTTAWQALPAVSEANACFLSSNSSLRFIPADNYHGEPSTLTLRLVDNTSGWSDGQAVHVVGAVGGSTPVSEQTLTLGTTINAVNDAPTSTTSFVTLLGIGEGTGSPAGNTLSALLGGVFRDVDGPTSALRGVVITQVPLTSQGRWQQLATDGWQDLPTDVNASSGLYLPATTRIRFVPSTDFNGVVTPIKLRLVDDSSASNAWIAGQRVDLPTDVNASSGLYLPATTRIRFVPSTDFNGVVTPIKLRLVDDSSASNAWIAGQRVEVASAPTSATYSSSDVEVRTSVWAVNDAPTVSPDVTSLGMAAVREDAQEPVGYTVSFLMTCTGPSASVGAFRDMDALATQKGILITQDASTLAEGRWQYCLAGTTEWKELSDVRESSARFLSIDSSLRFVPAADYEREPGKLTFRLVDNTGTWSDGALVDGRVNGGTTSVSAQTLTLGTSITVVNDAPTVYPHVTSFGLAAVHEDTAESEGQTVRYLMGAANASTPGSAFVDVDALASQRGILVIGDASIAEEGNWQYRVAGTDEWKYLSPEIQRSARFLSMDSSLRFKPADNYHGEPGKLTLRLVDNTSGWSDGQAVNVVNAVGGSTSVSEQTLTLGTTINAINDAPEVYAGVTSVSLLSVNEDTKASDGKTVTELLKATSSLTVAAGAFTDVDGTDTLGGILITQNASHAAQGTWEYRLAGTTAWQALPAVSEANACFLSSNSSLRFIPADNYHGEPGTLTLRLVDNTSGWSDGQAVNAVGAVGGSTPVSEQTLTLGTSIISVNDAPTVYAQVSAVRLFVCEEDGNATSMVWNSIYLPGSDGRTAFEDVDSSFGGLLVIGNQADEMEGIWQFGYEHQGWTNLPLMSASDTPFFGVFIDANTDLRFLPAGNFHGQPGALTVRLVDSSRIWANGETVQNFGVGGSTSVSERTLTIGADIASVNDAPTVAAGVTGIGLLAVNEDSEEPNGQVVSELLKATNVVTTSAAGAFVDADGNTTLAGVLITGNRADPATEGNWQYLATGADRWNNVPNVSNEEGFFLLSTSSLRFVPVDHYHGDPGALTLRLVDDSAGWADASPQNGATNGGRSSVSEGTVQLGTSIISVNDAPTVAEGIGTLTLAAINEDTTNPGGSTIGGLVLPTGGASAFADVDDGASLRGVLITGNAANATTQGKWQYRLSATSAWQDVSTVTGTSARFLTSASSVRFVPVGNFSGNPGALTLRLVDDTSAWDNGQVVNGDNNGGATSVSRETLQLETSITSVNDAPTTNGVSSLTIGSRTLGSTRSVTVSLYELSPISFATYNRFFMADADTGAFGELRGVMVTANASTSGQGTWQYAATETSAWVDMPTVSATNGLFLALGASIRFKPYNFYLATPGALTVRVVDGSKPAAWASGNRYAMSTGGASSVSSSTITLRVSVGSGSSSTSADPEKALASLAPNDTSGIAAGYQGQLDSLVQSMALGSDLTGDPGAVFLPSNTEPRWLAA